MTSQRRVLGVLAAGFAVTILLLMGSAWLSVHAMETVERQNEVLLAQRRVTTQLIDEIQSENAGLSSLFYELVAGPRAVDRPSLLARLGQIEKAVQKTFRAAGNEAPSARWMEARVAVGLYIAEVRRLLTSGRGEIPASLYRSHEELVTAIAGLVAADYANMMEHEGRESSSHRALLVRALALLAVALLLAVFCAASTIVIAGRMFRRAEWQARELSRLSGHVIDTQERILQRLSHELHDEFGQSLTAIEANLAAVPVETGEAASRIEDCSLLVKDLMSNVREFSQLLRPSTLDDFGLTPSLQWLAESFSQRTGIRVSPNLDFAGRLSSDVETHLFRIAQEALTNVAKHTKATGIVLGLEARGGTLRLTITDDGGGIGKKPEKGSGGLGLAGMRERMRMAGGRLDVSSDSRGLTVLAEVKLDEAAQRPEAYPSLVGG